MSVIKNVMKNNVIWVIVAAVLAYLYFQMRKGTATSSGYSVSTPFGGASITNNPLANTVNVSATLKKTEQKKKKSKLGGFLEKVGKPLVKVGVGYIPGVGPAAQAALAKW